MILIKWLINRISQFKQCELWTQWNAYASARNAESSEKNGAEDKNLLFHQNKFDIDASMNLCFTVFYIVSKFRHFVKNPISFFRNTQALTIPFSHGETKSSVRKGSAGKKIYFSLVLKFLNKFLIMMTEMPLSLIDQDFLPSNGNSKSSVRKGSAGLNA